jgi:hypothetical protein
MLSIVKQTSCYRCTGKNVIYIWKTISVLIAKISFRHSFIHIWHKKTLKQHKNVCLNNLLFIFYYSQEISVLESFPPNYRCILYYVAGFKKISVLESFHSNYRCILYHVAGFKNSLHLILVLLWFSGPFISLNHFFVYDED